MAMTFHAGVVSQLISEQYRLLTVQGFQAKSCVVLEDSKSLVRASRINHACLQEHSLSSNKLEGGPRF